METINIAKDFTKNPGARNYSDGPKSGQEFYETVLLKRFENAYKSGQKLTVILDGTEGYPSSFLNEAFRLLSTKYNPSVVWDSLIIISNEVPKYIKKVKEAIYEKK